MSRKKAVSLKRIDGLTRHCFGLPLRKSNLDFVMPYFKQTEYLPRNDLNAISPTSKNLLWTFSRGCWVFPPATLAV
jgi:hypothetical protein